MATGEQGYKIYTKIVEQVNLAETSTVSMQSCCSGERYRLIMVLLLLLASQTQCLRMHKMAGGSCSIDCYIVSEKSGCYRKSAVVER